MKSCSIFSAPAAGALALLILAPAASAQEWVGWGRDWSLEISAYSRNELVHLPAQPGEVMTRIESDEHAGWGTLVAPLPFRAVMGVQFATWRDGGSTAQDLGIQFRGESSTPGYPDLGPAVSFCTTVPVPTGACCMTVTRVAPVLIPISFGGDIFLSFLLPEPLAPGWPTEGIGIGSIAAHDGTGDDYANPIPPFANYDIPGPGCVGCDGSNLTPPPAESYGLNWDGTSVLASYVTTRQHWFDLLHVPYGSCLCAANPGAGGVGIVDTDQFSNYPSGTTIGTSAFLSGSSPDADDPAASNGNPATRCDPKIGMGIKMNGLGAGHVVIFLIHTGSSFAAETVITASPAFAPLGSTGVVCHSIPDQVAALLGVPGGDELEIDVAVPCGPAMTGFMMYWQAVAVKISDSTLHSSPCDRMYFK